MVEQYVIDTVGLLYQGLREKGEICFYQETLFTRDSERYVNEGSGNGHLSPYGPCGGNQEGGLLCWGL
jgi:hypothetical protein